MIHASVWSESMPPIYDVADGFILEAVSFYLDPQCYSSKEYTI
ncbi:hypothetical protein BH10CYA1_BH10CYA1_17750 [soil metagenome]